MSDTNDAYGAFGAAAQPTASDSGPMGWKPPEFTEFAADLSQSHPHYRITGLINHGGMGAVYRAVDTGKGTALAIKMLRPGFLSDPRDLARFQREIATLSKLKHDHIITILDHGQTPGGHHFFVMPYLGDRTLAHYTSGPRLPIHRVMHLFTHQVCPGVAHAHENGIIHRDLKPSNILLADPDERAIILDFGIARALAPVDDLGTLSRQGDKPGTHGYMAPERAAGREAGQPADIYSLGVIFYQLITGEILHGYPRPLSEFDRGLDTRFDAILAKALHPDPTQRYQTATEFAEALKSAKAPASTAASITDDEYPTPAPASITIEFGETSLVVNGLDFSLSTTIEDWMQVLGKYSEVETLESNVNMYDWHHLGISLRTYFGETETLYIAPIDMADSDHQYQSALFENHRLFKPFSGKLVINKFELPNGFDFTTLRSHDRRFRESTPDGLNETDYHLAILGGRFSFFELIRNEPKHEDDREKLGLWTGIQQSAEIHLNQRDSITKNPSLFWVSGAYCGGDMARDPSLKVTLLSITRYYTNQFQNHPSFNGAPLDIEGSGLEFSFNPNERVLLDIGGDYRLVKIPKSDHASRFTPHRILLTSKRLVVIESKSSIKSYDSSSGIRITKMAWKPSRNLYHVLAYVVGWLVISSPVFFEDSIEKAGAIIDHWGWLKIPILIFAGIIGICWWFYQWGYFFWGVSYLTGGELWGAHWKIDIETPEGLLKYRLKSKGIPAKAFRRNLSVTFSELNFSKISRLLASVAFDRVLLSELSKLDILTFWMSHLASNKLIKFPVQAGSSINGIVISQDMMSERFFPLYPCPTCGKEIAKSARSCPHCGQNLRSGQKPSGWRQKACSNCGEAMARFAKRCQQPDCGHPNTWLKVQSFAATLAVLAGGLWCWQHFRQHLTEGIELPVTATFLALGWRGGLSLLKSFYSH